MQERGEKTVAEIRAAGGKADFIRSDLQDAPSAREVAKRAIELGHGHVDILINNAGIFPFGPDATKRRKKSLTECIRSTSRRRISSSRNLLR